jgi:hypothetical protein
MLLPSVKNVFHTYKHVYIIPSELPDTNSDSSMWEVMLPTVCLLEVAWKITSPVPFMVFNQLGNPSDPFLPLYQFHTKHYNHVHTPIPVSPFNTRFTHGLNPLTNLSLLAEVCNIHRQLYRIKEECEATNGDKERTRKVPFPDLSPPLYLIPTQPVKKPPSSYTLCAPEGTGGQLVDLSMYTHPSKDHRAGNAPVRDDSQREYKIPTVGQGRAAVIPQAIQGSIIQHTAPPSRT